MRKSFPSLQNKQTKEKEKKEKIKDSSIINQHRQWISIVNIILFIPLMSMPANNNPNRTNHHRYSVNQSRPGPGQTRTKEPRGRRGWGCCTCIAQEHSPRSILNDTAQDSMVLVMYKLVQGGQRQRTWCPDRERKRERGGRPPPKWVTYLYPLCVRWTPPLTAVPWIFCAPWHSPRFHVGTSFSSLSPGFCYGPRLRIIRLDRVAGLRDWAGHDDGYGFLNGGCEQDYGWECCLRATDVGCVDVVERGWSMFVCLHVIKILRR